MSPSTNAAGGIEKNWQVKKAEDEKKCKISLACQPDAAPKFQDV